MMRDNKIVNGIWFGPNALNNIHKLCIRSYQDNGHEFHLWATHPIEGVPKDTVVEDASEIIPPNLPEWARPVEFHDYVKVAFIDKFGGWYVDMDTVCFRHFDFEEDYVFVSEGPYGPLLNPDRPSDEEAFSGYALQLLPIARRLIQISGNRDVSQEELAQRLCCQVSTANDLKRYITQWDGQRYVPASHSVQPNLCPNIFTMPPNSPFAKHLLEQMLGMKTFWLPGMFTEAVSKFGLQRYVKPPVTFDGIIPHGIRYFVSDYPITISPETYTIHLRTSFWDKNDVGMTPNMIGHPNSLFEQLKRKYGIGKG